MLSKLLGKGVRALQKGRVQRKLKSKSRKRPEASTGQDIQMHGASTKARQQAKIHEAQAGAKRAERGTKTEQVAERVLPKMGKVRARLQGMSASDIAEKYTGKEIIAMIRKVKNPQVLAKLQKAQRSREKRHTKFIKGRQGPEYPKKVIWDWGGKGEGRWVKTETIPRAGTRAAKLKAKHWKTGGTVKRKSGGLLGMGAALRGGGAVRKR